MSLALLILGTVHHMTVIHGTHLGNSIDVVLDNQK